MKINAIEYDACMPMPNQITVPTNSDFNVGIKVYRDGEEVNVKRHELSVNGQIASDQIDGYNIFELSSDGDVGMKKIIVDVVKPTTLSGESVATNTAFFRANRLQGAGVNVYLSSVDTTFPDDYDLYAKDVSLICDFRLSTSAGVDDTIYHMPSIYVIIDEQGNIIGRSYLWNLNGQPLLLLNDKWYYNEYVSSAVDHITIDKSQTTLSAFASMQTKYSVNTNCMISAYLNIDSKDGLKAKFPLQIQQTDTGYIERNKVEPFVYASSATAVADNELLEKYKGKPVTNVSMPDLVTIGANGMKDAFKDCKQLTTVDFSKLSAVGTDGLDGTFDGCTSLEIVLFQSSEAIPTITITTFANTNDTFKVIVPDALYEDWIADESWTTLSSHITKVSDYAAVMTNYGGYDNMDN